MKNSNGLVHISEILPGVIMKIKADHEKAAEENNKNCDTDKRRSAHQTF